MKTFVALLRAVNVGGTGKLPMKDLVAACTGLGFADVRTFIQSGNVVFRSRWGEAQVRQRLADTLTEVMGKPVDVMVRSAVEMRRLVEENPFAEKEPARVAVFFLSKPASPDAVDAIRAPGGEQVRGHERELYIYYPDGMGQSKLKLPASLGAATARNMNTVAKLAEIAEAGAKQ